MAVVKMQKLSICANRKHRKAVLEALQQMGAMEVRTDGIAKTDSDSSEDEEAVLSVMDTADSIARFEKTADSLDRALKILDTTAPGKKSGGLFSGKDQVTKSEWDEVVNDSDEVVNDAYAVLRFQKEKTESEASIAKDENQITSLIPWMKLGIPMNFTGTRETTAYIGTIPENLDEAALTASVCDGIEGAAPVTAEILSQSPEGSCIAVVCRNTVSEKVSQNLRNIGFSRPAQASSFVPSDAEEILKNDIEDQRTKISELNEKITAYASERERFRIAGDYFRTRAEKYRVLGKLPQSEHVFFLEGWVTAATAPKITKLLTEKFDCVVETEERRQGETEPTVLKNNPFSANVEGVLASYGLPQHGKIDPTLIMSVFYVWFFGMMLSDAGYGLVMALGTFIILLKHKDMADGMKKMLRLFFFCGLSTVFWGLMYGGFFGDAIDTIAKTFFGYTGPKIVQPLWFDPMSNPMQLLIFCMLFGLIHLFVGLGIKGAQYLKDHDVVGFLCDIVAWYAFLMGLILMLLPSDLFAGISGMTFNFPPIVGEIAKWMAIIGMVVIILMSARGRRNIGLRIALGAYDIYGITGWLSDVLSYSRLLALGLATGVIANVVNMMAAMFGGGALGVVIFTVIFIFGHVLNIAINALGAYVHTNRLQYVEFFGKFYDGGGFAFKPFKAANKYTEIKEDK